MNDDLITNITNYVISKIKYIAIAVVLILLGSNSVFTTHLGYNYVVQDTLFGTKRVISEVGLHFKVPFFTHITKYKQVVTIAFNKVDETSEENENFTRNLPLIGVTFADTYNGKIPATFRFKLPTDKSKLLNLHGEFRSSDNLINGLLIKNAKDVTVVTGTQYTGEEFFQGGLNSFKLKLKDQLDNGLYVTERQQVSIQETGFAAVNANNSNPNKLEKRERVVMKNVIQLDENGREKRSLNPLDTYGITVSQVTIDNPIPEQRLNELLITKKELVAKRISSEQKIITSQSEANAKQQEAEIDKRLKVQEADKERQLAIINGQKQVAVEKQQVELELIRKEKEAKLAVIQKEKELQMAQSNREIAKANAESAAFLAESILSKGLAEAEVQEEMLKAKQANKDVYLAEIELEKARTLYRNLRDFNIEMPNNVIMGSDSGKLPSNLDVLTAYGALGTMDHLKNQSDVTSSSGTNN